MYGCQGLFFFFLIHFKLIGHFKHGKVKCTFIADIKYSLINFTVHDLPFLGV